jgi:hypothetical protein
MVGQINPPTGALSVRPQLAADHDVELLAADAVRGVLAGAESSIGSLTPISSSLREACSESIRKCIFRQLHAHNLMVSKL